MENRTCGIVSYITWIGFIIALVCGNREDEFVKHHLNQALALNIVGSLISILGGILGFIPVIRVIAGIVLGLCSLVVLIIAVMGIVTAANGETKPLPVVGGIRFFK